MASVTSWRRVAFSSLGTCGPARWLADRDARAPPVEDRPRLFDGLGDLLLLEGGDLRGPSSLAPGLDERNIVDGRVSLSNSSELFFSTWVEFTRLSPLSSEFDVEYLKAGSWSLDLGTPLSSSIGEGGFSFINSAVSLSALSSDRHETKSFVTFVSGTCSGSSASRGDLKLSSAVSFTSGAVSFGLLNLSPP